ncbi:MAG: hypothetical protein ABII71_02820 [Candidatus Micrarchaeota archaeon]
MGGFISTQSLGFGLIGAGGAMAGAAFVPEGSGLLPPGLPSSAMMVGGAGMIGMGTALSIIGMGAKD